MASGRTTRTTQSKKDEDALVAILLGKAPIETTIDVPCDAAAAAELEEARAAERKARKLALDVAVAIEDSRDQPYDVEADAGVLETSQRVAAAEAKVRDTSVAMRFVALPGDEYEALLEAHAPTDEQVKAATEPLGYNPDTFPPALVAACCASPRITVEQAEQMRSTWNVAEWQLLWVTAYTVNNSRRTVSLGKG